jgi:hypothetical protein
VRARELRSVDGGDTMGETTALDLVRYRVGVGYPGVGLRPCIALELVDKSGARIMVAAGEAIAGELALELLSRLEQPPFAWRARMSSRARELAASLLARARAASERS